MSSPWEPAIPQAMQRHGGSNRWLPRPAQAQSEAGEARTDGKAVPEIAERAETENFTSAER